MPLPPAEGEEQPKLQFSVVECVLFTLHQLARENKEFLSGDRLKDFRQRLVVSLRHMEYTIYNVLLPCTCDPEGNSASIHSGTMYVCVCVCGAPKACL